MQSLLEFMNRDRLKKYKIKPDYKYFPKDKYELKRTINKLIKERGLNTDLNDIDTSKIDDMSFLFDGTSFDGDISEWDVSKVTNMAYMFSDSKFNGDISKWKVDNVTNMEGMFWQARNFDQNLDEWNINPSCNINSIFYGCPLQKHSPKWY